MEQADLYSRQKIWQTVTEIALDDYGHLVQWHEGDSLLDIGSGPGDVTINLLLPKMMKNFKKLIGIDVSQNMVNFAREKYCSKYANVDFEVADIGGDSKDLEGFNESFDHVTSFFCLHFVKDQDKLFSNIRQILKPGGDCFLQTIIGSPLPEAYKIMQNSPKWKKYMNDVDSVISPCFLVSNPVEFMQEHIEKYFPNSYSLHPYDWPFECDDEESLKDFLESVNPCIKDVPLNLRDEYLNETVKILNEQEKIYKNGKFVLMYNLLIIHATKSK